MNTLAVWAVFGAYTKLYREDFAVWRPCYFEVLHSKIDLEEPKLAGKLVDLTLDESCHLSVSSFK